MSSSHQHHRFANVGVVDIQMLMVMAKFMRMANVKQNSHNKCHTNERIHMAFLQSLIKILRAI